MAKSAQQKLRDQVNFLMKMGYSRDVATGAALNPQPAAAAPAPAPAAPAPPPAPIQIKPPTQAPATLAATGAGVGKSKKKVEKRRLSDLRIKRKKKAIDTAVGAPAGTGLNTPTV